MKKIYIVGSTGLVGTFLLNNLVFESNVDIKALSRRAKNPADQLDLVKVSKFDFNSITEDAVVVFCAAMSSPDECENDPVQSNKINILGTRYFIENSLDRGAKVIFLSSDTVYGSSVAEVNELSSLNPLGLYANQKAEIESIFCDNENYISLRLSYVFSSNDKYTKYLLSCARLKNVAEVFDPFFRRVVYINDIREVVQGLVNSWHSTDTKTLNMCGPELLSRKHIADAVKSVVPSLNYKIVSPPAAFFQKRPEYINMGSVYINAVLGKNTLAIADAIKHELDWLNKRF